MSLCKTSRNATLENTDSELSEVAIEEQKKTNSTNLEKKLGFLLDLAYMMLVFRIIWKRLLLKYLIQYLEKTTY